MKRRRISEQMMSGITGILLVFGLVAGGAFFLLNQKNQSEKWEQEACRKAGKVAEDLSDYYSGGFGLFGGFGSFFSDPFAQPFTPPAEGELWIVDRSGQVIYASSQTLPEKASELVQKAFSGEDASRLGVMGLENAAAVTAAVPVRGRSSIWAVVLYQMPVDKSLWFDGRSIRLFCISLVIALAAACLLARAVIRRFARPIEEMEAAAMSISAGNLDWNLPLNRQDELGGIAEGMKQLAERAKKTETPQALPAVPAEEVGDSVRTIRETLQTMQGGGADAEAAQARLEQECRKLEQMSAELTLLQRLQAPVNPEELQELNLYGLAEECAATVMQENASRNLMVKVSAEGGPFRFRAEREPLCQMLLRMLSYSAGMSADGAEVLLSLEAENGKPVLRIADSGCGIPPELLNGLFTRQDSAGLYLAVVRAAANRYGIGLETESTVGKGTVFTFRFP